MASLPCFAASSSPPCLLLLLAAIFASLLASPCSAFGTIGFDFHHRYSNQVKGVLTVDGLPEKGTPHYYAAMARRDRVNWRTGGFRGRGLLDQTQTPLSFGDGNETYRLNSLGFLHYANVSVGTPSVSFLVALDTGSDLFWLPCDCQSCVRGLQTSSRQQIDFNIYSPNASSTSDNVPCSNSLCPSRNQCPSAQVDCPYLVEYLDNGTSSTGVLVEDVLHLASDGGQSKSNPLEAKITFGCGHNLTGSFLDGAAPNGLFGLGMSNVSVPSTLAREGYTSNSFSMCFGEDGLGRISFGDTGSSDQGETPFNLRRLHPTYNVSVNQIIVGGNAENVDLSAIFDTGTSFTYLNDPAYTVITQNFDSLVKDPRHSSSSSDLPFEYCYETSSNQTEVPTLDLMMKGGHYFNVTDPLVFVNLQNGDLLYCLGLVKSGNVNIIGQNFMTGYGIVFDRERNVLGWRTSDCYASRSSNRLPIGPTSSASIPPATAVNPEATDADGRNTSVSGAGWPSGYHSPRQLTSFSFGAVIILVYLFLI